MRKMSQPTRGMAALIAMNAAALGFLAWVELSPDSFAQTRPRGTYVATAVHQKGSDTDLVWIVNETTQELVAIRWNDATRAVEGFGYRNLGTDAADLSRPRSN
jgi:hypothetical protein